MTMFMLSVYVVSKNSPRNAGDCRDDCRFTLLSISSDSNRAYGDVSQEGEQVLITRTDKCTAILLSTWKNKYKRTRIQFIVLQ